MDAAIIHKIIGRHKARTLSELEELKNELTGLDPNGVLDDAHRIVRVNLDYLRNDLVAEAVR